MPTLRLYRADLHYPPDLTVHTAISGPVGTLAELFLEIAGDGFRGLGEVRANIAFLTHIPEDAVPEKIRALVRALPWRDDPATLLRDLAGHAADHPNIARALVESALAEGVARQRGETVAELLGGAFAPSVESNQCLFWSPDDVFDRHAARYVAEGFRKIKVRIAIGDFAHDLARLGRLRARFGDAIEIAVDANGTWGVAEAVEKLERLADLGVAYVEQPTAPGDWAAFEAVLATAPLPLMLDEGLAGPGDLARLSAIGPPAMAHLKVVKLGGPMAVMEAARVLHAAGVPFMMGQMNEGALATAMAGHCALAAQPRYAELYGCYGLEDDVGSGLAYESGRAMLPGTTGLGVAVDLSRCTLLWEEKSG